VSKYLKYLLAVATLLIACATFAFAADGDTVVATVNGQPFYSLEDAFLSASAGSQIRLVSSTTVSTSLSLPANVSFVVPSGLDLVFSSGPFNVYGNLTSFGRIITTDDYSLAGFVRFFSGQSFMYGDLIANTGLSDQSVGVILPAGSSANLKIYNGNFYGFFHALQNNSTDAQVMIYGGTFSSSNNSPVYPLQNFVFGSGVSFFPVNSSYVASWGPLYQIGQIVFSAITWINLLCLAIVSNKLLLFFMIFVLGFVALGLIKRVINN